MRIQILININTSIQGDIIIIIIRRKEMFYLIQHI